MKTITLLIVGVLLGTNVFAAGRVLTDEESKKVMPLVCAYVKKAFENNSRFQVDLKKCESSKIYINLKDANYGTYVYGDLKVDSFNKLNCSIQLDDELTTVKLADCSDE